MSTPVPDRRLVEVAAFSDADESVLGEFRLRGTVPITPHYWRFNCGPLLESLAAVYKVGAIVMEISDTDPAFEHIGFDVDAGWAAGNAEVAYFALVRELNVIIEYEERTATGLVLATNERLGKDSPYRLPMPGEVQ